MLCYSCLAETEIGVLHVYGKVKFTSLHLNVTCGNGFKCCVAVKSSFTLELNFIAFELENVNCGLKATTTRKWKHKY